MKRDAYLHSSYYHIYNRGNRKQAIVMDDQDRMRFLHMLRYINNKKIIPNLHRQLKTKKVGNSRTLQLEWLDEFGPREPLVAIQLYTISNTHFHLLVKQVTKGGISKFMQRLGTGYSKYFNTKYHESGKLFQGSYKIREATSSSYLQYLNSYINVKNTIELFPCNSKSSVDYNHELFKLITSYQYSSCGEYAGLRHTSILDREIFQTLFPTHNSYCDFLLEQIPLHL